MNNPTGARTRFVVRVQPKAPLLLGATQTIGNYRATGQVISGRTWRGALAAALKQEDRPHFDALFSIDAADQAHFGPLFPSRSDHTAPYPPTVFSCKHHPGPFDRAHNPDGHGVFDTLARQYALEVATDLKHQVLPAYLDEMRCPECHAEAEPYAGYGDLSAAPNFDTFHDLKLQSSTHVAINRVRRVAEDEQLYVREGVQLGSGAFTGWIDAPAALVQTLRDILAPKRAGAQGAPDQLHVFIGANRSRGMGLSAVTGFDTYTPMPKLDARLTAFNAAMEDAFAYYQAQVGEAVAYEDAGAAYHERFFTVDLRCEAALLHRGLPTADLETDPAFANLGARVVRRWANWQAVGGWHAATRLPRRRQMAVMGCYLCRFDDGIDFDERVARLGRFERTGIGVKREQGFGQVTVCAPIHAKTGI